MQKKSLTSSQSMTRAKLLSLAVLGGSIVLSNDGCSANGRPNTENNNNNDNNGKGGNNNQPNNPQIELLTKESLKPLEDKIAALQKIDAFVSANYNTKTEANQELNTKLADYAKTLDLADCLRFTNEGDVLFKFKKNDGTEVEVKIVEKGVVKSSTSGSFGHTELQALLNKAKGVANGTDQTAVLNFDENTTFNSKKIDAIVSEVLAKVSTEYGYNDGTADTKGTLKVVIEAVVKAMIGATTTGTHAANFATGTKLNSQDIVTGKFKDLLIAELNSNLYDAAGGGVSDIQTNTTAQAKKLRELLSGAALNHTGLQALFTDADASGFGGKTPAFKLDKATIFSNNTGANTGTFETVATAIVKTLIGDAGLTGAAGTLTAKLNADTELGALGKLSEIINGTTDKIKLNMATKITVDNTKGATFTNTAKTVGDIDLVSELVNAKKEVETLKNNSEMDSLFAILYRGQTVEEILKARAILNGLRYRGHIKSVDALELTKNGNAAAIFTKWGAGNELQKNDVIFVEHFDGTIANSRFVKIAEKVEKSYDTLGSGLANGVDILGIDGELEGLKTLGGTA